MAKRVPLWYLNWRLCCNSYLSFASCSIMLLPSVAFAGLCSALMPVWFLEFHAHTIDREYLLTGSGHTQYMFGAHHRWHLSWSLSIAVLNIWMISHTKITGHRSLAETYAKDVLSPVWYGALRCQRVKDPVSCESMTYTLLGPHP